MNRQGMGPQTLRNTPNSVFQPQQAPAQRPVGLGQSRLQNGKLGSNQNWGFGLGAAGAPGISNQSRNNPAPSGFAQAIGGSGSQASLDLSLFATPGRAIISMPRRVPAWVYNLVSAAQDEHRLNISVDDPSEFPSLSGAPLGQQNSSASQAIWGNPGSRAPQSSAGQRVQRPNTQTPTSHNAQQPPQAQQTRSRQADHDSQSSAFSHIGSNPDEYRYTQNGLGQHSRSELQGSGDDFPPLSGLGGLEYDSLRREESRQEYQTNGTTNGGGFSNIPSSSRSSTLGQLDARQERSNQSTDRMFSPADGLSRATPMTRSPLDQNEPDAFSRADQNSGGRISQNSGFGSLSQSQLPFRSNQLGDHPQRMPQTHNSNDASIDQTSYSQMSDIDKWGLPGLMELLRGNVSGDQAAIALGMDLNTLGLDLQKPGNSPLHTDWPGPFADPAGPPIVPDFTLPPAYTVSNVPPLHTKIENFSDDTLFMIFYQLPRDEAQELAADALYKRDWRWHKGKMQWMMKCRDAPEPHIMPSRTEERGWYYFWDPQAWRRERKEFILQYEHLYHPITAEAAEAAISSPAPPRS